jgi:hypothetical protein
MRFRIEVLASSIGIFLFMACDSGTRVIPVDEGEVQKNTTGIFEQNGHDHEHAHEGGDLSDGIHHALVKEVLPTEKYVYLRVEENGEERWIATSKVEIEVGKEYLYKGGLLKRDFHSKEYDQHFKELYLVSQIIPSDHQHTAQGSTPSRDDKSISVGPARSVDASASIKIADIVDEPQKYAGKEVQVSGEVTKVNPNIMDRNWIHLKDGSMDEYDFVLTSPHAIPEGHVVTLVGTLALNKDFGSGYSYDILIEDAHPPH